MRPFAYLRPDSETAAIKAAAAGAAPQTPPVQAPGQFIDGGTNMLDSMKLDVMRPQVLVDIGALRAGHNRIEAGGDGLRLGAQVRMAEAQEHEAVKRDYPVVAQTLMLAASQQIRNMASLGGNVLQRTRCDYFREASWPCNKRQPGSGCSALDGVNRKHAILGTSGSCIASYPGDFAQALVALDASVETMGPRGRRAIRFEALHREPGDTPHIETVLEPGELITALHVPAGPWTRRSRYLKVRDRQSYAFATVSVAVALDLDGDTVREARLALGGVATRPWRAHAAEAALKGRTLDDAAMQAAADAAFEGAQTREHNAFKVPLGKQAVIRALTETRAMEVPA